MKRVTQFAMLILMVVLVARPACQSAPDASEMEITEVSTRYNTNQLDPETDNEIFIGLENFQPNVVRNVDCGGSPFQVDTSTEVRILSTEGAIELVITDTSWDFERNLLTAFVSSTESAQLGEGLYDISVETPLQGPVYRYDALRVIGATDSETDTGTDTTTDTSTDTDTDSVTDTDSDTATDTNTDTGTDTNTETATGTDSVTDTDSDTNTDTDSATDTDTGSDTNTGTDTDTGSDTDTGTDTDTFTYIDAVVIEEENVCAYNGAIETEHPGYLGDGYINTTNVYNATIIWGVRVETAGLYTLDWRYANGFLPTRTGRILLNNQTTNYTAAFPSTSDWNTWENVQLEIELPAGLTRISLTAATSSGLPNIDSMTVSGASGVAGSGI